MNPKTIRQITVPFPKGGMNEQRVALPPQTRPYYLRGAFVTYGAGNAASVQQFLSITFGKVATVFKSYGQPIGAGPYTLEICATGCGIGQFIQPTNIDFTGGGIVMIPLPNFVMLDERFTVEFGFYGLAGNEVISDVAFMVEDAEADFNNSV